MTEQKDGFDFDENIATTAELCDGLLDDMRDMAKRALPFRVKFLDDIAKGIMPTDLIVIGAPTGAGKTSLATIMAHAAAQAKTRVVYFALEAHAREIQQRMVYRALSDLAWGEWHPRRAELSYADWRFCRYGDDFADLEQQAIERVVCTAGNMRTYYRQQRFEVSQLTRLIRALQDSADLIIVDHLHFIDIDETNENAAMKKAIKAIADCVNDTETPVIAIAHLRKKDGRIKRAIPEIDDFHGSSDITKIATRVVLLDRAQGLEGTERHMVPTFMRVAKDRVCGDSGLTALLEFDIRENRYSDDYALGRVYGDKWKQLDDDKLPDWAKGVDGP